MLVKVPGIKVPGCNSSIDYLKLVNNYATSLNCGVSFVKSENYPHITKENHLVQWLAYINSKYY